jgi:RNA polymerase sigma-70 factor (ECF subfamily)
MGLVMITGTFHVGLSIPGSRMSVVPSSDRDLADAVLAGDADAFRVLVEREAGDVLRLCRRLLRDPDEADDAAQDAFIAAYRALPTWRGDGTFGAWVRRIAARAAVARLAARRDVPMSFPGVDDGFDPPDRAGTEPEAMVLGREQREELVELIASLPTEQRRVVALRFSSELSIDQIALATGVPSGTVKSRLHRAMGDLRDRFATRTVA